MTTVRGHVFPPFESRGGVFFRRYSLAQVVVSAVVVIGSLGLWQLGRAGVFGVIITSVIVVLALPTRADGLPVWTRVGEGLKYLWRRLRRRLEVDVNRRPPSWCGVRVETTEIAIGQVGVVVDGDNYLAGIRLAAPAAAGLQTWQDREALADEFAMLVGSLPRDTIDRMQILVQSRAGAGTEVVDAAKAAAGPAKAVDVLVDAANLLGGRALHTELVVVCRLARRAATAARKREGPAGPIRVIAEAVTSVAGQLHGGHVRLVGVLSPEDWRGTITRAVDPSQTSRSLTEVVDRVDVPGIVGPVVGDYWSEAVFAGHHHRTMWLATWPQMAVPAGFMAPLMRPAGSRAISILVIPEDPLRAQTGLDLRLRTAETALQTRKTVSPGKIKDRDAVLAALQDLADGHVPCRVFGAVTVSGADHDSLEQAVALLDTDARRCRIKIAPVQSHHVEAFGWTLPLCRGVE